MAIMGINLHITYPSYDEEEMDVKLEYYRKEQWYLDGVLHRTDGPAIIWYSESGYISEKSWFKDGEYFLEDDPSIITYNENGNIVSEYWYKNEISRDIFYDDNRKISSEYWYKNDIRHRDDGPAYIRNEYGKVINLEWFLYGNRYREFGPYRIDLKNNYISWFDGDSMKDAEVMKWITENNIEVTDTYEIVKPSDKLLFKLRWS